jgi:hypothetical protein
VEILAIIKNYKYLPKINIYLFIYLFEIYKRVYNLKVKQSCTHGCHEGLCGIGDTVPLILKLRIRGSECTPSQFCRFNPPPPREIIQYPHVYAEEKGG